MPYANYYPCEVDECEKPRKNRGMCAMHDKRMRTHGTLDQVNKPGGLIKNRICEIKDCKKKHVARGLCQMHYRRNYLYKNANTLKNKKWENKKGLNSYGYVIMYKPEHPNARPGGFIFEHRYVMSEYLGRPLRKGENVHHINGNRQDNRIENLEIWNTIQPKGQRVKDKVKYATEILELYAPELLAQKSKS